MLQVIATYKEAVTTQVAVIQPLSRFLRGATRAARAELEFRLSPQGDTRTGIFHRGATRRSSVNAVEAEYPEQQSRNGIRTKTKIVRISELVYAFGIYDANIEQIKILEFGGRRINYAARRPVGRVAEDSQTHALMLARGLKEYV